MEDVREVLFCDCFSSEHQYIFITTKDDAVGGGKEINGYIHPHLVKKNFWYRLKYGIKYILGRKSRYGAFDEIIVTKDNIKVLEDFVNRIKAEPVEGV